ncbi:hypothetical protein IAR55_000318 [Kwoniella newhampshirensis]|uniref:Aminotransferase class I/classII large domain-containing protein n=1 Tax=Kwoniella newhampshirensis TaxID=1651941 RepID=A0AAW0Z6F5_9TREE
MPSANPTPVKVDYASFLSDEAKGRVRSQLKELRPYFEIPGMISFGGGYPHPSTWPINGMTLSVPFAGKSVFVPGFENRDSSTLLPLAKYTPPAKTSVVGPDLSNDLQYSAGMGIPFMVKWLTEHVKKMHDPPYPDGQWSVLTTAGNTDGQDGIYRTLFNKGDSVLLEEFAYPAALTTAQSQGIVPAAVPMDGDGVVPADLDKMLEEWDEVARGGRRPKALLLVPTCSNPTGVTYPALRKREVYAVCRKWNILIIEDDPYCYLQIRPDGADSPLVPSFLSMDIDGRVVRMDSFSKFIAPGSRCGWITGPKPLVQAIAHKTESSTNNPSGISIATIGAVIQAWGGHEGLENRYLPHISEVYSQRGLRFVALLEKYIPGLTAEWPQPSGGMFLWLRLRIETHPSFLSGRSTPTEIQDRVFKTFIEERILTAPSSYFKTPGGPEWSREEEAKRIFVRLSFSLPTPEEMEEGIKRMARGLKKEWGLEQ